MPCRDPQKSGRLTMDKAEDQTPQTPLINSPPKDAQIVVPVRNVVLFPGLVFPITVGRPQSIAAAQQAVRDQRPIVVLLQRNSEVDAPTKDDLYGVGTLAN